MTDKQVVKINGLHYIYPDGTVGLEHACIDVYSGDSVAVVGPNGSGKSTLLFLIDGLLKPSRGEVYVFDELMCEYTAKKLRRRIGLLMQNPDDMLFNSTVLEDLEFGPAQLDMLKEEAEARIRDVATRLNIQKLLNKPPYRLSEGEKQRAALASILVANPDLLLLDEPTSQVDLNSKRIILRILNEFTADGKTIIFTTHDLSLVPYLANRVYVMSGEKRIVADGSVRDILKDTRLLQTCGLEPPDIAKLFLELGFREPPLTVEEAVEALTKIFTTTKLKT
ncbi:MAG: energy-coupling factor ABC transporter ATP-binding protein [Nitrososphaerales archaeon]